MARAIALVCLIVATLALLGYVMRRQGADRTTAPLARQGGPDVKGRIVGIVLFVAAAVGAIAWSVIGPESGGSDPLIAALTGGPGEQVAAFGYVGGEKMRFLGNPKTEKILKGRYGITLDARKAGSLEMVSEPALISQNPDFYWPSSQVAQVLARDNGLQPRGDDIVFNSPIVLFSWLPIATALTERGIARPMGDAGTAYAVDTRKLLDLIVAGKQWSDLGIDELYGSIMLFSTDPTRSNSGNQFAAMAATVLAGGTPSGPAFDTALATLSEIYTRMGYMEHSSSDLFDQYLRTGMGTKPIVAGYENQLIEFAFEDRDRWNTLADAPVKPVILYPEPTVYSSHVLMAMSDAGEVLAEALKDDELQSLAWREHGFRSGFSASTDPTLIPVQGVPAQVTKIIPMPPPPSIRAMLVQIGRITGAAVQ